MTSHDPLARPTTRFLYKYGSSDHLEWLETLLRNHQLYFPSPKQLNDPIDARPKLGVSSRDGALRTLVNPFLAAHAGDPVDSLAQDVRNMVTIVNTLDLDQLASWVTPSFHKQMERHRIYSMTTRLDNVYLWEHYAASHTGYCLEFQNSGLFTSARTVIYGDAVEIDFSNPHDIDATFLFKKTCDYVDEEEVRILLFPRGQPHEVAFEPTLLNRIILGKNMTAENRHTIRAWCRLRVPELPAVDE